MTASSAVSAAATAASDAAKERERTLQDELSLPILLTDRLIKSAAEAESTRSECAEIASKAAELALKLRATVRLTSSTTVYDRPIRRIAAETSKNLDRALTLVRKCKHSGILRHVFLTITSSATDFKKVSNLLESSIADFKWLLSIFADENGDESGGGGNLAIPPIASNDPIIGWVWSSIASLQPNRRSIDRIDAANSLSSLASDNRRYSKVIVEENAISPLLRLLKDGAGSSDGQVAAATALYWLAEGDVDRSKAIASDNNNLGIQIIVQVLGDSTMSVQIVIAELVAKIAEVVPVAREELGRENVLKPLISCLIYNSDMDEYRKYHSGGGKNSLSLHSVVQTAKNRNYDYVDNSNNGSGSSSYYNGNGSSSSYHKLRSSSSLVGVNYSKKDRENESPEIKHKLKTKCALALWRLCESSLLNCQKIAEPKGLFCLAKIIETEKGELRLNCLMTIMEIAKVAEGNADLRKAAWKPSSPPTKAVLDQLRGVIKEESNSEFLIPAIKAIGCLAKIFPAKETEIVNSLVDKLGDTNVGVAIEAAVALTKFTSPDNHIRVDHSKTIIDCNGVPLLMKLLGGGDRAKRDGLVLLCYLSMNVGNSKALVEARALRTLEGAIRPGMTQNADLRDIIAKAMNHLMLYNDGAHSHNHNGFAMV